MTKRVFLIILVLFLSVHSFINIHELSQALNPSNINYQFLGDYSQAEYFIERNYQNLIKLKNPLNLENEIFYPFKLNIALNDPGISTFVFYAFFRPFLNVHQSMASVSFINQFLSILFMYLLLKKLKIQDIVSIPISFSFGILPILSFSAFGAITYTFIFIYPLIFLLFINFNNSKLVKSKIYLTISLGIILGLVLLLNFYYFLSLFLVALFVFFYYLLTDFGFLYKKIADNYKYLIFLMIVFFISILPWLLSINEILKQSYSYQDRGFGGAVELSGDLAGFITPSELNPIYSFISEKTGSISPLFSKYKKFMNEGTVRFIYPGVLVLLVYSFLLIKKKKLPKSLKIKISFYYWQSIFFGILLLGPFLKVLNRWSLNLDGVSVIMPLPFLLFHYIPGFSGLRAPTRFSPVFMFFAIIVIAIVLNHFLTKFKGISRMQVFLILIFIIILDQAYITPKKPITYFPLNIYKLIERDSDKFTVFEIPFTVRDGFEYMGYVHAIGPMNGQLIHKKPIIGGYIARVPKEIFDFYRNKKFINYVANIIDKGNYNPIKGKPGNVNLYNYPHSISTIDNDVSDLNIRFIILKNDEKYTETISNLIEKVDFIKKMTDNNYDLYIR